MVMIMHERTPGEVRVEELLDFKQDIRKIENIRMIIKALRVFESISPSIGFNVAFDAKVDEVMKQMGLED